MQTWSKRLVFSLLAIPLLLFIPFIAMQFTNEVHWTLTDFLIMGALLLSLALAIETLTKFLQGKKQRIWAIIAALLIFFLIWAELAVGVFGTPFAGT